MAALYFPDTQWNPELQWALSRFIPSLYKNSKLHECWVKIAPFFEKSLPTLSNKEMRERFVQVRNFTLQVDDNIRDSWTQVLSSLSDTDAYFSRTGLSSCQRSFPISRSISSLGYNYTLRHNLIIYKSGDEIPESVLTKTREFLLRAEGEDFGNEINAILHAHESHILIFMKNQLGRTLGLARAVQIEENAYFLYTLCTDPEVADLNFESELLDEVKKHIPEGATLTQDWTEAKVAFWSLIESQSNSDSFLSLQLKSQFNSLWDSFFS